LTFKGGSGNDVVTIAGTINSAVNSVTAATVQNVIQLGAGNDTVLLGSSGVIAAGSLVDGGTGTDTVAASLLNAGNASIITNFEVLGLDLTSGTTYDSDLLVGATGLDLQAQGATYSNVEKTQSLSVKANIGSSSTTLAFTAANVVGTADTYSVSFAAEGTTTDPTSPTSIDAGTLVIEGIENVSIASDAAKGYVNNTIDLTSAKLKTVTLTGSAAKTTLGFAGTVGTNPTAGLGGAVSSIDASAYTGELVLSTGDGSTGTIVVDDLLGLTIKGGSGKDTITLRNAATVDAGAGNDAFVLSVDSTSSITYTAANSILTGGAGNDSYDVSAIVIGTDTSTGFVNNTAASIMVTITDFTAGDTVDFSSGTEDAETALGAAAAISSTNLADAITAIVVAAGTASNHIAWGVYGGNTYVVHNADKGSGTDIGLEAGDVVVKLSGVIDLSSAAFSAGGVLSLS
jgi:hypothetical protein